MRVLEDKNALSTVSRCYEQQNSCKKFATVMLAQRGAKATPKGAYGQEMMCVCGRWGIGRCKRPTGASELETRTSGSCKL